MASVIVELPIWARGLGGTKEKFPFDEWFDGQVWKLVRGEDFTQPRGGMAHRIRAAATKRKLRVGVAHKEDFDGTELIVVFALGKKYVGADGTERVDPINQKAATYLVEVGAAFAPDLSDNGFGALALRRA